MKSEMSDRRIVRSCPGDKYSGQALIDYLSSRFDYKARNEWADIIKTGQFSVNGNVASPESILTAEARVEWHLPEDLPEPEVDAGFGILLQDNDIIAVNKTGNLPTHPAGAYFHNTLWWMLRKKFGEVYPVNRLDRETSGVVLFARSPEMAAKLQNNMPDMEKVYILLAEGKFPEYAVTVHGWMRRDTTSAVRKKQMLCDMPCGKEAVTVLRLLEYRDGISKLEARPLTGRMHQIRLAAYSMGFPVVGDKLYGVDENFFIRQKDGLLEGDFIRLRMKRQALHASVLSFIHPVSGEKITLTAPLPDDFIF